MDCVLLFEMKFIAKRNKIAANLLNFFHGPTSLLSFQRFACVHILVCVCVCVLLLNSTIFVIISDMQTREATATAFIIISYLLLTNEMFFFSSLFTVVVTNKLYILTRREYICTNKCFVVFWWAGMF